MKELVEELKRRFPWLGTDEPVEGSEVTQTLSNWYDLLNVMAEESNELTAACAICGNVSSYDEESLKASTYEINGIPTILCCPCEDDLILILGKLRLGLDLEVGDGGEVSTIRSKDFPSIQFNERPFWQIGCSKCDSNPGDWKIYHDGKKSFIAKCYHCGYISKIPPDSVKTEPDNDKLLSREIEHKKHLNDNGKLLETSKEE